MVTRNKKQKLEGESPKNSTNGDESALENLYAAFEEINQSDKQVGEAKSSTLDLQIK